MSFYAYKTKEIVDRNRFKITIHDCIFGIGEKSYRGIKLRIFWNGLYHESVFDRDFNNNDGRIVVRVWTVIRYVRKKMISKLSKG